MTVDSAGLGYSVNRGEVFVHYPRRDPMYAHRGSPRYGAGFPIGPIPDWYWTDPPNDITRERVAIWADLLEGS